MSVSVGRDDEGPIAADALGRVTWALRRAEWAVQARKEQRLGPETAARLTSLLDQRADVVRDA